MKCRIDGCDGEGIELYVGLCVEHWEERCYEENPHEPPEPSEDEEYEERQECHGNTQ